MWAIRRGWEIHHWRCGSVDEGGIPECGQEYQDTDDADGHRRQQVKYRTLMFGGKMVKRWWALTAGKIEPLWIVAILWHCARKRGGKVEVVDGEKGKKLKKDGTNRGKWNEQIKMKEKWQIKI